MALFHNRCIYMYVEIRHFMQSKMDRSVAAIFCRLLLFDIATLNSLRQFL